LKLNFWVLFLFSICILISFPFWMLLMSLNVVEIIDDFYVVTKKIPEKVTKWLKFFDSFSSNFRCLSIKPPERWEHRFSHFRFEIRTSTHYIKRNEHKHSITCTVMLLLWDFGKNQSLIASQSYLFLIYSLSLKIFTNFFWWHPMRTTELWWTPLRKELIFPFKLIKLEEHY
jgi:hypothetical protein